MSDELAKLRKQNAGLRAELGKIRKQNAQYLQNVAHLMISSLGAIKWGIEGAKSEANIPAATRIKMLQGVYGHATHLVHVIDNFRLMTDLEANHDLSQYRSKVEDFDFSRVATEVTKNFELMAIANGKKMTIDRADFLAISRDWTMRGIRHLTAQAISNILENAIKYAEEKSKIVISPVRSEMIGFRVTSRGLPISEEERSEIFKRHYRSEDARQKVPAGTGLGLYLTDQIIELHKGRIELELRGEETMVTLLFPAA